MVMNNLNDVLLDTIKDLYHAEKQLVKALPRMAKAASSDELRDALEEHLEITEGQVERLEQVFDELDISPKAKVCRGMVGIIEEGKEVLGEQSKSNPAAMDAAIIAAGQKVEHYEISAYGSARTFAQTLGLNRVAKLLEQSLDEEKEADQILNDLAESSVNEDAASEMDGQGQRQGRRGTRTNTSAKRRKSASRR